MLFVKATKTIILGLLFLLIAGCAIAAGIIFASLPKSVSYVHNYVWVSVYIKAIAGSVRDYVLILGVRTEFLIKWVRATFTVIMFLLFVPINFILFMLYIPLFYICIFYWVYKIVHYPINPNIKEVAPYKDFTHPNSVFTA